MSTPHPPSESPSGSVPPGRSVPPEDEQPTSGAELRVIRLDVRHGQGQPSRVALGILRIEIHGSWSVSDFVKLLGRLEDAYKAAAAFESLLGEPSSFAAGASADDVLQTVTAFRLAGGLRLGSISYGSPGFLDFIGALNPLKTVKDGITENRDINRKRDETRRLDEREREQQAMQHEEAMARHSLEVSRLQIEAERERFNAINSLIDRLPDDQQTAVAAQLLRQLTGTTEAIAGDARIDDARMLELDGQAVSDTCR